MKRRIYVYQNELNDELELIFSQIGNHISIESIDDDVITLLDEDYFNEEPVDLEEFYVLLVDDFGSEVTVMIEPYLEEEFTLQQSIVSFIKKIPYGVYDFEDIISYAVLKDEKNLKQELINYIKSKVNNEVIHTVREFIENNMNSSVSAKKLYMHRNTLNYRIDNFIEATKINVKTFKGANAIYMLFKY